MLQLLNVSVLSPSMLLESPIPPTTQNVYFYLSHCSAVSRGLNSYLVIQPTKTQVHTHPSATLVPEQDSHRQKRLRQSPVIFLQQFIKASSLSVQMGITDIFALLPRQYNTSKDALGASKEEQQMSVA